MSQLKNRFMYVLCIDGESTRDGVTYSYFARMEMRTFPQWSSAIDEDTVSFESSKEAFRWYKENHKKLWDFIKHDPFVTYEPETLRIQDVAFRDIDFLEYLGED